MLLHIDTDTDALLYTQIQQLEGIEYSLRFLWSTREDAWYLDFSDQDGNAIAPWIRLVVGTSLLRRFQDPRLPRGILTCVDMTGAGMDIVSSDELGQRVPLLYITSDDALLTGVAS
jgi:hypothetical protein